MVLVAADTVTVAGGAPGGVVEVVGAGGGGEAEQDGFADPGAGEFGVFVEFAEQGVEGFGAVVVFEEEPHGAAVLGPFAVAVGRTIPPQASAVVSSGHHCSSAAPSWVRAWWVKATKNLLTPSR